MWDRGNTTPRLACQRKHATEYGGVLDSSGSEACLVRAGDLDRDNFFALPTAHKATLCRFLLNLCLNAQ